MLKIKDMNNELNKTQKKKVCKFILNNTDRVVEGKYERFLVDRIFPGHPEFVKKVGCGIDHIEVRDDYFGKRCFYIVRTDGTFTDISYIESISPRSKTVNIRNACRTAIFPIISDMRGRIDLPYTCPITGDIITDMNEVQIDHYDLTFKEVFDLWVKEKDLDELASDIEISNVDGSTVTSFTDENIIKDFVDFHNKHTHLRAVSKRANLSILKRK